MYIKVSYPPKNCLHCNSEFIPNRSDKQFCKRSCKRRASSKRLNKKYKRTIITWRAKIKDSCCNYCGFIPLHRCQLDIDHIDGNSKNNDPSNLQTLCANCHRLKTWQNKDWENKKDAEEN